MSILLTNDDGIDAPGLAALAAALAGLDDLYVSAPLQNRSGVGMGVTIDRVLTPREHPGLDGMPRRLSVDGSPADAVKYGLQFLLRGERPRLVVSGINHGPNIGRNVRCSGTVGAACEAFLAGIPALAVSADYAVPPVWEGAKYYARLVAEKILSPGAPAPLLLNLNVPALPPESVPGLVLARHGQGGFHEYLVPAGGGLELGGKWLDTPPGDRCDAAAFTKGYAVLTPMRFEMTDDAGMGRLRREWTDILMPEE